MSKIIGYATGVFDLFHIGHLNILKHAKALCDELIVGVLSDDMVIQIKKKNPIIPLIERMEIVANIKYVDKAVAQTKIDEIGDYKRYKFNKIFKGSDRQGTEKRIQLEKKFQKLGVQVIYLPYDKTTSSTLIRTIITKEIERGNISIKDVL